MHHSKLVALIASLLLLSSCRGKHTPEKASGGSANPMSGDTKKASDESPLVLALAASVSGRDLDIQLRITNRGSDTIIVPHPSQRGALRFDLSDSEGRAIEPMGVAKVDPKAANVAIRPGEEFRFDVSASQYGQLAASKNLFFPFLSSTALFAYALPQSCTAVARYQVSETIEIESEKVFVSRPQQDTVRAPH